MILKPPTCGWEHVEDSEPSYLWLEPYIWFWILLPVAGTMQMILNLPTCGWNHAANSEALLPVAGTMQICSGWNLTASSSSAQLCSRCQVSDPSLPISFLLVQRYKSQSFITEPYFDYMYSKTIKLDPLVPYLSQFWSLLNIKTPCTGIWFFPP